MACYIGKASHIVSLIERCLWIATVPLKPRRCDGHAPDQRFSALLEQVWHNCEFLPPNPPHSEQFDRRVNHTLSLSSATAHRSCLGKGSAFFCPAHGILKEGHSTFVPKTIVKVEAR